jgi:peptidoglycan hydrolase-like protein with peptidoglycan-binding domain
MNQTRLFSISMLAAAWVAFNTVPVWAQTQSGESQPKGTGQSQAQGAGQADKSVGGTQSQRQPETGTPMPPGAGQADKAEKKEPKQTAREGKAGTQWAKEDIKEAQEALQKAGHNPGPIDGIMGPQTQQALKAFQSKSGLKETGRLDDETAKKLGVEKGPGGGAAGEKQAGKEPTGAGKGQSSSPQRESSSPMGK